MAILTSEEKHTNRYLERITDWKEENVAGYKTKVKQQLLEPWMRSLVLFLFMFTVGGIIYSLIWALMDKILHDYAGIGLYVVYLLIGALLANGAAKKNLLKFVEQNNGEVAHPYEPYEKKVKLFAGLSVGFGVAVVVICMLAGGSFKAFLSGNIYWAQALMFVAFYPTLYYLFTLKATTLLYHNVCPICGRFEAVCTEKTATYGKNKLGEYEVKTYGTAKVGEKITTTTWSDGSRTSSSTPIYGTVCTGSYMKEYGTKMSDYFTYCKYCSYFKEETTEEKYTKRIS